MKNPKVHDRVRYYYDDGTLKPLDGQITDVSEKSGTAKVLFSTGNSSWKHRTHLIRLKPKRKAEVVEFECEWTIGGIPNGDDRAEFIMERLSGKRTKVTMEVLE
jgi:hypothetical protein